ncbi:Carbohydrate-selective porin, OprB family [Hyella patelloides LEGE 07179]|uniref:Carbohydrate-selective porin, OprB family n=1 Tax=Hyella patelloides LEGE 07179 TaxID=945734 RepID=A0A563VJ95_9CYAN|nr:iron uptake porin [Hyella patelloides]VEP11479.1 Carbohydrate-selective porin, OprB family [Hyella patelloides LEGE 07179]
MAKKPNFFNRTTKIKIKLLKTISTTFPAWSILLLLSTSVSAESPSFQEELSQTQPQVADMGEVTPVHQLLDVPPSDWKSQAFQALSDRTLCLGENYQPDERLLTRYEFAAGLQVCLDQINQKYLSDDTSLSEANQALVARFRQEFAQELATLRDRTDNLETRTAQLEDQRFSTTTKLNGEVLFQLGDSFSGDDQSQLFTGYRARLNFDTSFFGEDRLRIRLGARNTGELEEVEDTFMVRLGVDGESDNEIETELSYDFAVGERIQVVTGISSVGADDVAEVLNPLSSSGQGAVSRFARRNPSTLRGPGGSGAGIQYEFSDSVQVAVGYFVDSDDAAAASGERGLFGGSYSAVAQLLIEPIDDLEFAFTYTRTYYREDDVRLMGATGSENANEPFGEDATSANGFGFQANWELSDRFGVGGWFGYTDANQETGNQSATILNGAVIFNFPDLGAEGNEGGIIIGVPPIVTQNDDSEREDERTSLHIEAIYRIQLNDQTIITPGVFVITQPDHSDRDPIWVGTIRTQFRF